MILVTLLALAVLLACSVIIFFALSRKGEVKANLKIPFASFFIEANDRPDSPGTAKKFQR